MYQKTCFLYNFMAEKKKNVKKSSLPAIEEEILNFWDKNKIFEKSLEQTKNKKEYIFYRLHEFC